MMGLSCCGQNIGDSASFIWSPGGIFQMTFGNHHDYSQGQVTDFENPYSSKSSGVWLSTCLQSRQFSEYIRCIEKELLNLLLLLVLLARPPKAATVSGPGEAWLLPMGVGPTTGPVPALSA
jgi:hypothetical protein